jgi:hypothetical protein
MARLGLLKSLNEKIKIMTPSNACVFMAALMFFIAGIMAIIEIKPVSLIIAYFALAVANSGFGLLD